MEKMEQTQMLLRRAQLFDQRHQEDDAGAHGGHGDHLELCLNGGILAVGVALHYPAGVVDQRHVAQVIEHLVDQDQDDEQDPIAALQAGLDLFGKGRLRRSSVGRARARPRYCAAPRSHARGCRNTEGRSAAP